MKSFVLAAVSAAALLTACGGGGNSGETKAKITSVKVVGASLADSGTFGFKFTVQSGTSTPYRVYPERIAATYGLPALCPAYVYSPTTSPFPHHTYSNANYDQHIMVRPATTHPPEKHHQQQQPQQHIISSGSGP